jgi:radical SAM protein with 4Fe4S-binding SPASM domain
LTPETYEVYRVGGQLHRVISGMKTLRRLRDALQAKHPKIVLQWLPMKHNEAELPQLEARAREWGADCVEIKTTQVYSSEEAEQFLPQNPRLSRYHRQGQRWEVRRRRESCRRLWFSCQVDWDGTVVPCCFDKDEEFVMGNIRQESLAKIWRGKPYQRLRQSLLTHGRTLDMCLNCTEGLKTFYISRHRLAARG